MQVCGDWVVVGDFFVGRVVVFEGVGVELFVFVMNMMYFVVDWFEVVVSILFLYIVDFVVEVICVVGLMLVGLFGIVFMMEQLFYVEWFVWYGICIFVFDIDDCVMVYWVIYDEFVYGIICDEFCWDYVVVIECLVVQGVEGVIFGCIEIELFILFDDVLVLVFLMIVLYVEVVVVLVFVFVDC